MIVFIQKQWFLICLAICIGSGLFVGLQLENAQVENFTKWIDTRVLTGIILFLMSFTLDSRLLVKAIRFPLPILWACVVNFGLLPILGWLLMPLQLQVDFRYGLMIAASVPCTMAAASVWTRKANGNDAVSLMVTLLTNGFCFLITPFWLMVTTSQDMEFNITMLMMRLIYAALIPMALGQAFRQIPLLMNYSIQFKTPIGTVAQSLVLVIVLGAAITAGQQLTTAETSLNVAAIAVVWISCIAIHVAGMFVAYAGGRIMKFEKTDRIAVLFAASQKTLPIGLLIATSPDMMGNPNLLGPGVGIPFALFPMLMYHASQLFIDTFIASGIARRATVQDSAVEP